MVRVTVLELAATWGQSQRVLDAIDQELAEGPATDLVVLPEASLTGYVSPRGDFDLTPFAEPLGGPTTVAVQEISRRHAVALVAPLVLREDNACYNAMIGCDGAGQLLFTYRKRRPWHPETWATAGRARAPVVNMAGLRVTIAICYDLHFLAQDASQALDEADLLLFPSAWVEEDDTREERLATLAVRHRLAIANANWAAGVVAIPGQGGSSIVGRTGDTLARVTTDEVASLRARGIARADASLEVPM